jgi:hypothetical protein
MEAETVIRMVHSNERLLRNVQCRYRWLHPETRQVFRDVEWGYEGGREFIRGTFASKAQDGRIIPYTCVYAFDGKVVRSFIDDSTDRPSLRGGVYGYDPYLFSVPPSPKTLLGYTLDQGGIYTLSELLSHESILTKSVRREAIGKHECIVLEATRFAIRDDTSVYDLRIWIDPERNYRPLRMEKWYSPDNKDSVAGVRGKRWELLDYVVDNIELQEIDGVWFPVCGESQVYEFKAEPVMKGETVEDVQRRYPGMSAEELVRTVDYVNVPFKEKGRVELKEVRINRGIDPEKFTIAFPNGCDVWDNIAGIGYKVGPVDATPSLEVAGDNDVTMPREEEGTKQSSVEHPSIEEEPHTKPAVGTEEDDNGGNRPGGLGIVMFVIAVIGVFVLVAIGAQRWM